MGFGSVAPLLDFFALRTCSSREYLTLGFRKCISAATLLLEIDYVYQMLFAILIFLLILCFLMNSDSNLWSSMVLAFAWLNIVCNKQNKMKNSIKGWASTTYKISRKHSEIVKGHSRIWWSSTYYPWFSETKSLFEFK